MNHMKSLICCAMMGVSLVSADTRIDLAGPWRGQLNPSSATTWTPDAADQTVLVPGSIQATRLLQ